MTPFSNQRFGQAVRTARKAAGLSQAELAQMLEISQPRLSALENGDADWTLDRMSKAAELLDLEEAMPGSRSVRQFVPVDEAPTVTGLPEHVWRQLVHLGLVATYRGPDQVLVSVDSNVLKGALTNLQAHQARLGRVECFSLDEPTLPVSAKDRAFEWFGDIRYVELRTRRDLPFRMPVKFYRFEFGRPPDVSLSGRLDRVIDSLAAAVEGTRIEDLRDGIRRAIGDLSTLQRLLNRVSQVDEPHPEEGAVDWLDPDIVGVRTGGHGGAEVVLCTVGSVQFEIEAADRPNTWTRYQIKERRGLSFFSGQRHNVSLTKGFDYAECIQVSIPATLVDEKTDGRRPPGGS